MATRAHVPTGGSTHAGQRGSALVLALFVLFLTTLTGMSLLFLSTTEATMSRQGMRVSQAFYLAEAGEESARTTLYLANGNDPFTDDLIHYAGDNGTFDLDASALAIVFDGSGEATGVTGVGDDQPLVSPTRFGTGWYAAFVTNDPAEDPDGIRATADTNDLVMLTSIAVGPDGTSELVQSIVQRRELLPQLPSATITMLGPQPLFNGGDSNVHEYSGEDCDGRGIPGLTVPVLGAIGSDAEARAEQGIRTHNGPDYESGAYSGDETFVDLTDSSEPLLTASGFTGLDETWTDCEKLHELVESMRDVADVVCGGPSCAFPATRYSNVLFVDGDLDVAPPGGSGTLVVTGEMRFDGRASWSGMIFVVGEGRFIQQGSGNGVISGAIVVADIAGPDNVYGTGDDCSGGDDGFSSAVFDMSGGGTAETRFCSADMQSAMPNPPYRIVNFRQG